MRLFISIYPDFLLVLDMKGGSYFFEYNDAVRVTYVLERCGLYFGGCVYLLVRYSAGKLTRYLLCACSIIIALKTRQKCGH